MDGWKVDPFLLGQTAVSFRCERAVAVSGRNYPPGNDSQLPMKETLSLLSRVESMTTFLPFFRRISWFLKWEKNSVEGGTSIKHRESHMVIGHLKKNSPLKTPRGALGSKKLTKDFFWPKKGS